MFLAFTLALLFTRLSVLTVRIFGWNAFESMQNVYIIKKLLQTRTEVILISWLGAIYLVGILAFGGTTSFGTIVAISDYAIRFWGPISNMSASFNQIINAVSYLERIFEVIDEPVIVDDTPDAKAIEISAGEVKFDNVTFAYESNVNILENVSFTAHPGESIAFVGPTGCG